MAARLGVTHGFAGAYGAANPTLALTLRASGALWAWCLRSICVAPWTLGSTASTTATVASAIALATALALRSPIVSNPLQHFGAGIARGCLHDIAARWFAGTTPDGLTPHGNGFCDFTWLRSKTVHHLYRNGLLGEALNVLHKALFVQAHQIHRGAVVARAARAADAVHIFFADIGDFLVHDVRQIVDIYTTCCNISSNQRTYGTGFKAA